MEHAVKILAETDESATIGGYGVVWGGTDLYGEHFTKGTNFWEEYTTAQPPLLYDHGLNGAVQKGVIGRVTVKKMDDTGIWIEAEIDKAQAYATQVLDLVRRKVLGYSSGSIAHLVEVAGGGEIRSWPIVEMSLTPTPAEPRTLGVAVLDDPAPEPAVAAKAADPVPDAAAKHGPMLGSFEERRAKVSSAINAALAATPGYYYAYPEATYDDRCVVEVSTETAEGQYAYRYAEYPYSVDADGAVTLGEPAEVAPAFVPTRSVPAESLADQALRLARRSATLAADTKGLLERRAGEGRDLSDRNRKALTRGVDGLRLSAAELDALLAASDPKAKALALDRERERAIALLSLSASLDP